MQPSAAVKGRYGDPWPDDARLSDLEQRFVCKARGCRGADVRPDFDWQLRLKECPTALLGGARSAGLGDIDPI
jgi:hypothetical protein